MYASKYSGVLNKVVYKSNEGLEQARKSLCDHI